MTAADVAQAVGVSRATVGFVLNDTPGQTISEATRQRVLDAAIALGYRPNSAARALARGRSEIVLLVLPDWPMDYAHGRLVEEFAKALDEAGYSLVTWSPREDSHARPLWERLHADLVMGFAPFDDDQQAGIRANGVSKLFPTPDQYIRHSAHWLAITLHLQVDHLRERGHRRIAYAGSPDPRLAAVSRDKARKVAARAAFHGMEFAGERVVDVADGSADRAVRAWVEAGCTAVVACNDYVAAMVAGAALRAGIAIPERLAVIGHDDSPLARVVVPTLTSVRIDAAAAGREAAASALHELGVRPLPAEPDPCAAVLVIRESTGGTATGTEVPCRLIPHDTGHGHAPEIRQMSPSGDGHGASGSGSGGDPVIGE